MNDGSCAASAIERVTALKKRLGDRLVILAHHYQRAEIVEIADHVGDSFELSRRASEAGSAEIIVFCGVHFMAESAAMLSEGKRVYLPVPEAGCPMADMADVEQLESAWTFLTDHLGDGLVPVVYMNSSAAVKAFCGARGGVVCTSGNAGKILEWAFDQGKKVLFLPDEHLGRNTGELLGLRGEEMPVWNPYSPGGGLDAGNLNGARLILWRGFCLVHQAFSVEDVELVRREHPGARVYVHPECRSEVVRLADGAGSTAFLVDVVRRSGPGDELCIGTELRLVQRLAAEYRDRNVFPLRESICENMSKVTIGALAELLENFDAAHEVMVPEELGRPAADALRRMLNICV